MFINILRCTLPIILLLRIVRGSSISIGEQPTKDALRQAKSEEMRRYMNELVDPCDNFYEFSCGNYGKLKPFETADDSPPTMPNMQTIADAIDANIKSELGSDDNATDTGVDRKLKNFYKSCVEMPLSHNGTSKQFEFLMWLGKMPVELGESWTESNFDWVKTVGEIVHKTGVPTIFGIGAITDFTDNSINRVGITEPKFTASEISYFLDEENAAELRIYYTHLVAFHLMDYLGIDERLSIEAAAEMVDFEISLVHGKSPRILARQNCDVLNLTTLDALQNKYLPDFDAKKLLGTALAYTPSQLYVNYPYLENALKVVKNTPPRVVANYLIYSLWKQVYMAISIDRERECVQAVQRIFYQQLDNMIYRKRITEDMKKGLYVMWHALKATFQTLLESPGLNWMQEHARRDALDKLNAMKFTILGYEDNNFEQQFAQLHLKADDYVHNIIALLAYRGNRTRAAVHEPPKPEDEGFVASYSPSYSPIDNMIKIPVGVLQQYNTFSSAYPNAFNFATLGAAIGHEMSHGFDDLGGKYDAKGNSRNWWDTVSAAEFHERSKCFIDQYKKYIYRGQHLPEMQTQSENISDNGGVRTAYAAYLQWYENALATNQNLEFESLPGFNYTNKQLFFISYGQLWCNDQGDWATDLGDTHVPKKFRVVGPLSNFDEFSKEFNCPLGSAMNPEEKCKIY